MLPRALPYTNTSDNAGGDTYFCHFAAISGNDHPVPRRDDTQRDDATSPAEPNVGNYVFMHCFQSAVGASCS